MGSLTAARPAEAYEIAGIQALQDCSERACGVGIEDTLLPMLAMSLLCESGALRGQIVRAHVTQIADAIHRRDAAAEFLNRAASGFARCCDVESAAELLEAATLRRLRPRHRV